MTVETYQSMMREFGVSRGRFEPDGEFADATTIGTFLDRHTIDERASLKITKPPLTEDLSHLNPKTRSGDFVRLLHARGETYETLAERLGVSPKTVRTLVCSSDTVRARYPGRWQSILDLLTDAERASLGQ